MRAIVLRRHGGPDVLHPEEVPAPEMGPGDVLVRVRACALNNVDLQLREGLPREPVELPRILGADVAGVVEAAGPLATNVTVGQEVMLCPSLSCGLCVHCLAGEDVFCRAYRVMGGGYAEYLAAPAANVFAKPPALSFEEAASMPLVFLTAWHMLVDRARLRRGEDCLVQAAGSGVGVAAVQIAALLGARVIATAGSDWKLERARMLGAEATINYSEQDLYPAVRAAVGSKGLEVVFEHVGGATFETSLRLLATNGRLVTCGSTAGPEVKIDLRYFFRRHISLLGSRMGSKAEFHALLAEVGRGHLRPVVDRVFPLDQAAEAHRYLMSRSNFGKVVLHID